MGHYGNVPKKKKVYVDESGQMFGLGKGSMGTGDAAIYTGSGTLLAEGHLTLSGSQFKNTSVIIASYHGETIASGLTTQLGVDEATFRGVPSMNFFYAVYN